MAWRRWMTLGGALLGGFAVPVPPSAGGASRGGLALDHADNTLWVYNQYTGMMEHWTKAGVQLGDGFAAPFAFGAEFPLTPVPEPSTGILAGTMLLGMGFLYWRHSRRT
jgi:hypothetical protein